MTDDEIIAAVEAGLPRRAMAQTVIEPRVHLVPDALRRRAISTCCAATSRRSGSPASRSSATLSTTTSRPALRIGGAQPLRSADRHAARHPRRHVAHRHAHRRDDGARRQASRAQGLARSSAMSARAAPRIGTCGCSTTCSSSTRSACIRAGRRAATRSPTRLARDLGKPVIATDDWESCVRGADIVVEASRLPEPQPLLKTAWIKPGALVVPYGTMSAVEISLTDIMNKIVVDDWGQCRKGMPFGALRRHVDEGRLNEGNLHAELGADRRRARRPAASTTTRRSCSGIAACRCPTSRSAARCSTRRARWASARRCASSERRSRARGCTT